MDLAPAEFLYSRSSYDFDSVLARRSGAQRVSPGRLIWVLIRKRPEIIEINEPAQAGTWPLLLAVVTVTRVLNLAGPKIRLVSYAIENGDLVGALRSKRVPAWLAGWLARTVVTYIYTALSRCVFGTASAESTYRLLAGRKFDSVESRVILALPARCECLSGESRRRRMVFLGSLEQRKGVPQVLRAWESLAATHDFEFLILGKGPLESRVLEWASAYPNVEVVIDPARERIHAALRESSVLVLLSQSEPRWREQVGLPIVEGLAHGLEIVASSETGLASWLDRHGHRVLPPDAADDALATALGAALVSGRTRTHIASDLPPRDGRIDADAWLWEV